MREVVIVEAVRSPVGKREGKLSRTLPAHLAARVLNELVARAGIEPAIVEDVIFGCVTALGEQGANVTRLAVLQAGFPVHVPAVTLNRMCGSSQQAIDGLGHERECEGAQRRDDRERPVAVQQRAEQRIVVPGAVPN